MAVGGSSVSDVRQAEPAASAVVDQEVVLETAAAAAAAVHPPLAEPEEAAAVVVSDAGSEEITNWVEMPLSNLRWILARTRETDPVPKLEDYGIYTEEDLERKDPDKLIRRMIATLQADQDDFFEYQAWVSEVYQRNGRVMVPEDLFAPTDELNKELAEVWRQLTARDAHGTQAEAEASDTADSSGNQVLQPSEL